MRALRRHGNQDIRIDDIPEPPLKLGWVKVKNDDLHEYRIGPKNAPTKLHVMTGETLPTVCGHELAGTIAELGEGVTDLEVGEKVAIFPVITDGTCHWCDQEAYGLCFSWGFLGYSGFGGGMVEYICVERKAIHRVPNHMSLEVAALVEPLAVGWHAVQVAGVKAGDQCLVVGAGPIGIAVVHCLQAHGFEFIVVSEPSASQAEQAKKAGAANVLNPKKDDVAAYCRQKTDNLVMNAVFECAGSQLAFDTAFASVRGKGILVNVAIYETPLRLKTPNILNRHQIRIAGSNVYTRGEFQVVIDAIASGKIKNPETMITARVPLENAIEGAFQELLNSTEKHVKILISPTRRG